MNKFIYGLLVSSAVLTSACGDDFLTEEPLLSQSTELTMSTIDDIELSAVGAYSYLSSEPWYGAEIITHSEMRTGNARIPAQTDFQSGRCTTQYNWSYTSNSTMSGLWSYAYKVISNVNNILDNIDGKADEDIVNGIKAECYFLRALSYFDLVRTFAQPYTQTDVTAANSGVPVVLHTENGEPARNTIEEVYTQIEEDLLLAESLFPDYYNTESVYHTAVSDYNALASKEAAQALLSRVYLYMGQWQKAADYATTVINSGRYSMWDSESFLTAWNNEVGSGEVIFEAYGSDSNYLFGYDNWEYIQWLSISGGYADFAASHDIYDMYDDADARKQLFATDVDAPGQYWTTKYAGKDTKTPSFNNIIILRLSEMYLNRAEAILNGASVSGVTAQSDMNIVASNRGVASEAATLRGVFNERRKELAFEAHSIYDFARNGYSITRVDTDSPLTEIPFPSYRWALPIPLSECEANHNMVQNEGY